MPVEHPSHESNKAILGAVIGGLFAILAAVIGALMAVDSRLPPPPPPPPPTTTVPTPTSSRTTPPPSRHPPSTPPPATSPVPQPRRGAPELAVDPEIVAPGETVTVRGVNFRPGSGVTLRWYIIDDSSNFPFVDLIRVDAKGSFTVNSKPPAAAAASCGTRGVVAAFYGPGTSVVEAPLAVKC